MRRSAAITGTSFNAATVFYSTVPLLVYYTVRGSFYTEHNCGKSSRNIVKLPPYSCQNSLTTTAVQYVTIIQTNRTLQSQPLRIVSLNLLARTYSHTTDHLPTGAVYLSVHWQHNHMFVLINNSH